MRIKAITSQMFFWLFVHMYILTRRLFASGLLAPKGALMFILVYYIHTQPLLQIFQILQILKYLKDPTCGIFLKSKGFKDIKRFGVRQNSSKNMCQRSFFKKGNFLKKFNHRQCVQTCHRWGHSSGQPRALIGQHRQLAAVSALLMSLQGRRRAEVWWAAHRGQGEAPRISHDWKWQRRRLNSRRSMIYAAGWDRYTRLKARGWRHFCGVNETFPFSICLGGRWTQNWSL